MSARHNLDREPFQTLLADAFAVQESGIDSRSLVAYLQIERSIAMGECDRDQILHLVAEEVRKVANATGAAIALLKGDELLYRAGSGSAATYVGKPGRAVLSVSGHSKERNEILRVEDAEADRRIEADICRQFGVRSLLILPIYRKDTVAGVLVILFNAAHCFGDQEVRTYRLMAELVKEAVFGDVRRAAKLPTAVPSTATQIASPTEMSRRDEVLWPPAERNWASEDWGTLAAISTASRDVWPPPKARATFRQTLKEGIEKLWWNMAGWKVAAAAVGMALIVITWINYDHHPASPTNSQGSKSTVGEQILPVSAKSSPKIVKKSKMRERSGAGSKRQKSVLTRARISHKGIDYIGDDVTVRHFPSKPAPVQTEHKSVSFGNDVTVHYFAYKEGSGARTDAAPPPPRLENPSEVPK